MKIFLKKRKYFYILLLVILVSLLNGCYQKSFVDISIGYTRFEPTRSKDIESEVEIEGQKAHTKLTHIDGVILKTRIGKSFIESLPQLRTGIELRGGIGGAYDSEEVVNDKKAYSEILLLLIGGGPFISWKQPLGKHFYIEYGGFITGYTVGIHEKGEKEDDDYYKDETETATGWSGGIYGKIGVLDFSEIASTISIEVSYEIGAWDFNDDIGYVPIRNISALVCTEVNF